MASKNISIRQGVYERLRKAKLPEESFSDVIERLAGRRSLLELVNLIPKESAEKIAAAIEQGKAERIARRRKELGL